MFLLESHGSAETSALPHPASKLADVGSLPQSCSRLVFGHLVDEVFGVGGGLSLHGGPDRSGHLAVLAGWSS